MFVGPESQELVAQKVVLTKWENQGVIIWAYFITPHLLFLYLVWRNGKAMENQSLFIKLTTFEMFRRKDI